MSRESRRRSVEKWDASVVQCHPMLSRSLENGQENGGTQSIDNCGVNHLTFVVESRCQHGTYFEKSMVSGWIDSQSRTMSAIYIFGIGRAVVWKMAEISGFRPMPSPGNVEKMRIFKKSWKTRILGVDSHQVWSYNPPPLSLSGQRQSDFRSKLETDRCLKKLDAFWKRFAGGGTC